MTATPVSIKSPSIKAYRPRISDIRTSYIIMIIITIINNNSNKKDKNNRKKPTQC